MAVRIKNIPDEKKLRKILEDRNLKATPQRLAVHRAMLALGHACAEDICAYIKANESVRVAPSSVYNILSEFNRLGIYALRSSRDSKVYFDANTGCQVHLYDSRQNEFKDLDENALEEMVALYFRGRRFRGYRIDSVEVQVICHPTRKQKPINQQK